LNSLRVGFFAGSSEGLSGGAIRPGSSAVGWVGLVDEFGHVQLDGGSNVGYIRSGSWTVDEQMLTLSQTQDVLRVVFSGVSRVLVNGLDLVSVEYIVRHVHRILDTVLLPFSVPNLLELILSEGLVADAIGGKRVLSAESSGVDLSEEGR